VEVVVAVTIVDVVFVGVDVVFVGVAVVFVGVAVVFVGVDVACVGVDELHDVKTSDITTRPISNILIIPFFI